MQLVGGGEATVVRLRGNLSMFLASASAAGDGFHWAIGVGVVNTPAFDTGVAALPQPITEMEWDGWLWHRFGDVHVGDKTAGDVNWISASVEIEVDSKAMRILRDEQTLVAVMELVEIGTAEVDVFFDTRTLFKLA